MKIKNSTILLIDANLLLHMAFYTTGHLSMANGRETGIIFGFLKKILSIAQRLNTNRFFFCWDDKGSLRRKIYPDYKKKRREKQKQTIEDKIAFDSMFKQRDELINKILPSLGFKNNFIQRGYEGDDLLAWWAQKLKQKSVIITTDADMHQCLNHCNIWNPRTKKLFTKDNLLENFGVTPEQFCLAKAIGGCNGDGVEGIQGVADPKSVSSGALKYLRGQLQKGVVFDRIESKEGKKTIKRNLPLVTIPFKHGGNQLQRMIVRRDKFERKKFLSLFDQLHFISLLEQGNFTKWEKIFLQK